MKEKEWVFHAVGKCVESNPFFSFVEHKNQCLIVFLPATCSCNLSAKQNNPSIFCFIFATSCLGAIHSIWEQNIPLDSELSYCTNGSNTVFVFIHTRTEICHYSNVTNKWKGKMDSNAYGYNA
jgi:hypothetical protein